LAGFGFGLTGVGSTFVFGLDPVWISTGFFSSAFGFGIALLGVDCTFASTVCLGSFGLGLDVAAPFCSLGFAGLQSWFGLGLVFWPFPFGDLFSAPLSFSLLPLQ